MKAIPINQQVAKRSESQRRKFCKRKPVEMYNYEHLNTKVTNENNYRHLI